MLSSEACPGACVFKDFAPLVGPCSSVSFPSRVLTSVAFLVTVSRLYHLLKSICCALWLPADPFYSLWSGMFHSATYSSSNLVSPLPVLLPAALPSGRRFPPAQPLLQNPSKVSSLFLMLLPDRSFPDTQAVTLMPSNYTTHTPSVFYYLPAFLGRPLLP